MFITVPDPMVGEEAGEEKSSCHGGVASMLMQGAAGRSAVRESKLEEYLQWGGRMGIGIKPALGGPQGPGALASSWELGGRR